MSDPEQTSPATVAARLQKGWPLTWFAVSTAWVGVAILLLTIPTDPKNRQLLGLSTGRIALLGLAIIFGFACLTLAWLAYKRVRWRQRFLDPIVTKRRIFLLTTGLLVLFAIALWLGVFIYSNYTHPIRVVQRYAAYYERAFPFFFGFFLSCTILIVGLLIMRHGVQIRNLQQEKSTWQLAAGLFGLFLLCAALMGLTGIGIKPDKVGWGGSGVPLLFYQVLLAWMGGLFLFCLALLPKKELKPWQSVMLDLLLCIILWISAVWAWSEQNVQRSYFAPSPLPPNNEVYPYSDAGFYDYTAQSLLLGNGFLNGQVVPRPLYILLLATFHAIGGQGYEQTIYIQTLFLALLPVFLYLLGKTIHSRGLGLSLGILAIAREVNSILATPWVEVSHSKLFMADLPTTLVMVALAWLGVRWLIDPKPKWADAILVGGLLGITTLFRSQALLLLTTILLTAAWVYWKSWKLLLKSTIALLVGLCLVLAPWLIRNRINTGNFVFDDPATQNALIAQRYSAESVSMPARQPGETDAEFSARLSAGIRQFLISNPRFVATFVTSHALNNLVSTVLVLPLHFSIDQRCDTLSVCTPFWTGILNKPAAGNAFLLLLNLAFIALGIAASWRRWKAGGLIPLFLLLTYSLSNALARNSARRYILPVDWVGYLYLLIGLFEMALWIAMLFGARRETLQRGLTTAPPENLPADSNVKWSRIWIPAMIFLIIGLALPLVEILPSPHFILENPSRLLASAPGMEFAQELPFSVESLESFTQQENAIALQGRVFYPRYYGPLEGEPGSGWPAFQPYEYRASGKIGFILVGSHGATQVNLALDNVPDYFPNAADALLVGCQEKNYVDALVVVFLEAGQRSVERSQLSPLTCPLR